MALNKKSVRHLIFDLDDTLFDTFGQLVEPASREACQAMVNAGLNASFEECLKVRHKIFSTSPRKNVYHELVAHFGVKSGAGILAVEQAGIKAFYDREVREDIHLFPDALPTLTALARIYKMTLVTLGAPRTQTKKVKILGLESHFTKVVYVDISQNARKSGAFRELMEKEQSSLSSFVSIGNRIDSDIHDAKELGMQAILMHHGEYKHLEPHRETEIPDARVSALSELVGLLL